MSYLLQITVTLNITLRYNPMQDKCREKKYVTYMFKTIE